MARKPNPNLPEDVTVKIKEHRLTETLVAITLVCAGVLMGYQARDLQIISQCMNTHKIHIDSLQYYCMDDDDLKKYRIRSSLIVPEAQTEWNEFKHPDDYGKMPESKPEWFNELI